MATLTVFALAGLLIGFLVGGTGIGGFLLPVILTGALAFPVRSAFTLSFIAFTVSGIAGAWFYWKAGNLDIRRALLLSAGSVPGAWIGVTFNSSLPVTAVTLVLYSFIFLSSLFILFRRRKGKKEEKESSPRFHSPLLLVSLGFITAAFCSFAGAGGPILVIPILSLFGLHPKESVGTALLNSVFIGLTASLGYSLEMGGEILILALIEIIAVSVGALAGNRFFRNMEVRLFSIVIAAAAGTSSLFLLLRVLTGA